MEKDKQFLNSIVTDTTEEAIDGPEYRMYCFVLRQLSPIQKGIQTAHAIVEYANRYGKTEEYKTWARSHKTIIMLDGGVVRELMEITDSLKERKIRYSVFKEEDLGNIMTCISVLVDERVFDEEDYPSFETWRDMKYPVRPMHLVAYVGGNFDHDPNDYTWEEHYKEWLSEVKGDEKTEYLRELIESKRLAR